MLVIAQCKIYIHLTQKCLRCVSDVSQMCLRSVSDVSQMCLRCVSDVSQMGRVSMEGFFVYTRGASTIMPQYVWPGPLASFSLLQSVLGEL